MPKWYFAKRAGGSSAELGHGVAVDHQGNVFITGRFDTQAHFGTTTLTSSGQSDVFVAKLDAAGNWLWATQAYGTSQDDGTGIVVDSQGNIFVSGYFNAQARFGTTILTSSGRSNVFVAKLGPTGNWLWARQAGGTSVTSDTNGYGVAVDQQGNVFVTGSFYGQTSFGTTTFTSSRGIDMFIAKLDTSGNWLWVKQAGGTNTDYGFGVAVDTQGNAFVTGSFYDQASFGTTTLSSPGKEDIFVAKLDAAGNWLWSTQAGGINTDYGSGIAIDNQGNAFVTGWFHHQASFGTTTLSSRGGEDVFVAKLDAKGNWLWARQAGGASDDRGYQVAVDNQGNIFITGLFRNQATFGTTTLSSAGNDIFVTKLNAAGNWLWAIKAGGTDNDIGNGVTVDSQGHVFVIGSFHSQASFGNTILSSSGSYDVFVAKLAGRLVYCSQQCVDLNIDSNNCGACGNVCASGKTCQRGACQ